MKVDLNADVGEINADIDRSILNYVSSCNVCCNAHAGSEELISDTIATAIQLDVSIGAHPSWPDRENFGRKSMDLPQIDFKKTIHDQILFVDRIAKLNGGRLRHVKPHGALYHDLSNNDVLAEAFIEVVKSINSNLIIFGMSQSGFANLCSKAGTNFIREAFADRRYENVNCLLPRRKKNAVISNTAEFSDQIRQLASNKITDVHGNEHRMKVDSICIHSDSPEAASLAELAHQILKEQNVAISAP